MKKQNGSAAVSVGPVIEAGGGPLLDIDEVHVKKSVEAEEDDDFFVVLEAAVEQCLV